jgi:hypothetical protein
MNMLAALPFFLFAALLPGQCLASGFLQGVRDLVYDGERNLVLTAAIKGAVSVINVSSLSHPALTSSISPSSVRDAHGMAYDYKLKRAFVASVSEASVTCVDLKEPLNPRVLSVV